MIVDIELDSDLIDQAVEAAGLGQRAQAALVSGWSDRAEQGRQDLAQALGVLHGFANHIKALAEQAAR